MLYYLDGILVDTPVNWQETASTIRKDRELNLFLLYQDYTLIFDKSGYDYILSKINGPGFCETIDVEIKKDCGESFQLIFSGTIFIADCEVNEKLCVVKTKINDKSFFSKINNNKQIKTSIDGAFTKNGENILVSQLYQIDFHDVVNNNFYRRVDGCRVYEAFRYLIDFMTDNTIGFRSDTFNINGEWEGLSITTGFRMRGGNNTDKLYRWIPFSFIELFEEVNKRIPIILLVENPFENPIIRIESIEYLYGQQINFIASDIDEIITTFDDSKLYAKVKFGSPTDIENVINFPETTNFYGFREEEFHVLGRCNIDRTLDLSASWVVSSNIIEKTVLGSTSYDTDLFLINTLLSSSSNGRTTNDNFLGQVPALWHYNALLNNASISDRYVEDLSNSIAAYYINSKDGEALGWLGTLNNISGFFPYQTQITTVLPCDQEAYDYGGYYDQALYRYTALQTASYQIVAKMSVDRNNGQGINKGFFQFWLVHYDVSNNVKNIYQMWDGILNNNVNPYLVPNNSPGTGVYYEVINLGVLVGQIYSPTINGSQGSTNINMVQGDYLELKTYYEPMTTTPFFTPPIPVGAFLGSVNADILSGVDKTFIKCVSSSNVGGTFLNINEDQFKIKLHKFNYPMTQNEFNTILANPIGRIGFAMKGQPYRYGWINELKFNHAKNFSNISVITNKQSQNAS